MSSFWSNLYDSFKDRRYGTLFFGTLLGLLGLLAASWLCVKWIGWQNYIQPFLLSACILISALSWRLIRQTRKNQRAQSEFVALSRDELAKARSKLRNEMKPLQRAPPRAPDTNLKY